jgi:hypothetical protein
MAGFSKAGAHFNDAEYRELVGNCRKVLGLSLPLAGSTNAAFWRSKPNS